MDQRHSKRQTIHPTMMPQPIRLRSYNPEKGFGLETQVWSSDHSGNVELGNWETVFVKCRSIADDVPRTSWILIPLYNVQLL